MNESLLALIARARTDPHFLASLLQVYAETQNLDDAGLVAWLGCAPEDLPMLQLCRPPRTDNAGFREDVELICKRFHIEPTRLADCVKRARTLLRLRETEHRPTDAGYLLAARDREEGETGA
jgi:hypothetical protein